MLRAEAIWLGSVLCAMSDERFPLLNLGSSTESFRVEGQPWIHSEIFAPLERKGRAVIHVDSRTAPGVDVVADLANRADRSRVGQLAYRTILCSNLLEHLEQPEIGVEMLLELSSAGQLLVVSGPLQYPPHPDPIDNGFRGTPDDIAALFGHQVRVVQSAELVDQHLARMYVEQSNHGLLSLAAALARPWRDRQLWQTLIRWGPRRMSASAVVFERI
ncbi:MAG: hypothetical protein JO246_14500 [Frankiaceae bacterium]|nr:hypothetical protein [Frankiaceae bacterium]MBV9871851.1 hypothetical protein [Frankiaceae bacterium]